MSKCSLLTALSRSVLKPCSFIVMLRLVISLVTCSVNVFFIGIFGIFWNAVDTNWLSVIYILLSIVCYVESMMPEGPGMILVLLFV